MKYDHRVKVGGKWFDAGVEVNSTPVKVKPQKPETPQNDTQTPDNNGEDPETTNEQGENDDKATTFTRTQIQQMNKETLIATAKELGIDFEETEVTGNELKQMIMGKLGI